MKTNYKIDIVKYFIIIGITLCAISHLFAWGTIQVNSTEVNIYSWGIHSGNDWGTTIYPPSLTIVFPIEEINELFVPFGIWIAIFIIAIMAIIVGVIGLATISTLKKRDLSAETGILTIIIIVLFYFFINFGFFSTDTGMSLKSSFSWSFGYFLMLISGIMFFIAFFINKYKIGTEN